MHVVAEIGDDEREVRQPVPLHVRQELGQRDDPVAPGRPVGDALGEREAPAGVVPEVGEVVCGEPHRFLAQQPERVVDDGPILSVVGGKYTTFRVIARDAVTAVVSKLKRGSVGALVVGDMVRGERVSHHVSAPSDARGPDHITELLAALVASGYTHERIL